MDARAQATAAAGAMAAGAPERSAAGAPCRACLAGDGTCPSCVQRGAYALRLVERGLSVAQAAARLRLAPERTRELIEDARDRAALRSQRGVRPSIAAAQDRIESALAEDPELTRAEIARRMDPPMHPAEFDRTFGYAARKHDGPRARLVSVRMGSRLMIALGRAPHELDGC